MKERLLALIPRPLKQALRTVLTRGGEVWIRPFALHGVFASAFYFFFSRRFDREHLAVLRGRVSYRRSVQEPGKSSTLLRRNIHRIEKGLIMRPRRALFGEEYIGETVKAYERAVHSPDISLDEIRWATDVLDEYFGVVADSGITGKARAVYAQARSEPGTPAQAGPCIPYRLAQSPAAAVSFEDLFTLFVRRRSVRWYRQQEVPIELIQQAIHAAALAPSACNRQPFRFIVSDSPERATEIARCAGGTRGFAENVPAILVVVGDLAAYPGERDRHLIYIDSALASMQLMLAAETLGLSTCPINWPDVDRAENRMRRLLGLAAHERVIMLIAIGYGDPNSGVAYSQKKSDPLISVWQGKN